MDATDGFRSLVATAQDLLDRFVVFMPALVGALVLLIVGWLLGRLLAKGATKLIDRWVPGLEQRATGITVARLGIERRLGELIGSFVFWVVLVIFGTAATETLGLPVLATWVSRLGTLLPQVFIGALVVLAGFLLGTLTRDAVATAARAGGVEGADLLGRVAQVAVVVVAIITGIDQVGIDSQFVTAMLTVTVAGAFGGTALAFAFGARAEVSNLVAMHYARRNYQPGQRIEVDGVRGQVSEFTTTTVVLSTGEGLIHVPGRLFSDRATRVFTSEE